MDKLPESGCAELEDRERQIDGGVIVHQPPRHDPEQRLRNRQLADRGRPMEKNEFHAPSFADTDEAVNGHRCFAGLNKSTRCGSYRFSAASIASNLATICGVTT